MTDCLNTGGAPPAKKAKTNGGAKACSEKTITILRGMDTPTVFNAVHQLTPKPIETVDQWRDAVVMDPNTQYTDATVNCMQRPVAPETAAVGYAVCIEVTTNEPDSHEAMSWQDYYAYLQAKTGPIMVVLKDVDTQFMPHGQRSAVFGDGMATLHTACGVSGAVCDGVIRDLDGIKRVPQGEGKPAGFPIWATGEVSGHGRFVIKAFNVPVTVGQLRINPGDLIMADAGGVVRIPIDIADNVAERSENIRGKEKVIFEYFRSPGFKASEMGTKQGEISAAYDKAHPESFA